MTSNQIAYWKNVETERANRENEALKREQTRVERELGREKNRIEEIKAKVSEAANALKSRELDIKDKAALMQFYELYQDMGPSGVLAMAPGMQEKFLDLMGLTWEDFNNIDEGSPLATIYDEFWRRVSNLGGGSGIGKLITSFF